MIPRDYMAQAAATADGQYPKAVVLSCLDSRVPPEIVFDQGIGDLFVGRVAGNFENTDMLGSLEFATKIAGSKLIVVLGHTSCGAIKGAVRADFFWGVGDKAGSYAGRMKQSGRLWVLLPNELAIKPPVPENVPDESATNKPPTHASSTNGSSLKVSPR